MTLKPCPFCGGDAEFERHGTTRQSCIIVCDNCGCTLETGETGEHCGDLWNTRVPNNLCSKGNNEKI